MRILIEAMILSEKQRWREVLKSILVCIKYLVSQNLALRGHEERLDNDCGNPGNFLSLLKLICQYNPIISDHLKYARDNPGSVSYLSPEIQNEFIGILANSAKQRLIGHIIQSKYYGLLVDSTPDLAHREQLSQVIRFVDINFVSKKVCIKEVFLGFIELHSKDAASLEKVILERLESDGIPLDYCRSQCYDNASVMAGHLSGLQQRICARNHCALFLNYDNHSLNLAGLHSAKQDPIVVTFFGTIEKIYTFFSALTLQWKELIKALPIVVKRECETRWSSRAEAVKAVCTGLGELVGLLEKLSDDANMTHDTRSDAQILLTSMKLLTHLHQ